MTCARSAAAWDDLGNDPRRRVSVAGQHSVGVTRAVCTAARWAWIASCAVGGPTLLDGLVDADAVVEICVTLAPKLAGSRRVGGRQWSRLSVPVAMRLEHALAYDDYLFLKYRR